MPAAFEGAGSFAATCTFFRFTFRTLCNDLEFNSTVFASEDLPVFHIMAMNTH
jgi:hypothetical protein